MSKGDGKLIIGLALAVLVIAIIVVDPLSEQHVVPTEADRSYVFSNLEVVCDASRSQQRPDIDGNIVVWQDYRSGNWDIYGYDLSHSEEFQVTDDYEFSTHPKISGDVIVWHHVASLEEYDEIGVFFIDNLTTFFISNESADLYLPSVYGDYVVYSGFDASYYYLYLYDLSTDTEQVIHTSTTQMNADIWGGYIALRVAYDPTGQKCYIYYYDISYDELFLIDDEGSGFSNSPVIFDGCIMYLSYYHSCVLYYVDTAITEVIGDAESPIIYSGEGIGSQFACFSSQNIQSGYVNLTVYDINTEQFLYLDKEVDMGVVTLPTVGHCTCGGKVVFNAYLSGDSNIYMVEITDSSYHVSPPRPIEQVVGEFVQDYWPYLVVIIVVVVVTLVGVYMWRRGKGV